ncbi:MAG: protease, partial [Herminiimonas sp.]|nr:protease [Herminiimonas sp.]
MPRCAAQPSAAQATDLPRGHTSGRWLVHALLLGTMACLAGATHSAERDSERNRQKRGAEEQRAQLQQKLTSLKQSIDRNESEKRRAADALALSEAAISEANRTLADLAAEQAQTEQRLALLIRQQRELKATLALRQKQLSAVLREQYVSGNEDRTKLLLSGDDPSRINRALRYMGYVSKAQGKLIDGLRASIKAIEQNQTEATEASADLNDIAAESLEQKRVLEQQKNQRTQLLAQYATRLTSQRAEVGRLQKDESRLGGLVEQLGKLIEAQQKAEQAAKAEREAKAERVAKADRAARAEREAKAEQAAADKRRQQAALVRREARGAIVAQPNPPTSRPPRAQINRADAIDADEPLVPANPKVLTGNEPKPEASVQAVTSLQSFAGLKGR